MAPPPSTQHPASGIFTFPFPTQEDHRNDINQDDRNNMFPNPAELAKNAEDDVIADVPQLGTIGLEELNKYHCNNEERRLLSLFGIVFDVTTSEKGYGKNGACTLKFNHSRPQIYYSPSLTVCPQPFFLGRQTRSTPDTTSLWPSV
jgi:hypothetical protein